MDSPEIGQAFALDAQDYRRGEALTSLCAGRAAGQDAVWWLTVQKLTAVAWVITDPAPVTQDSLHSAHAGDRCWLEGCNRLFDAGERVAYTAEVGDRKPVCARHAE